MAKPPVTPCAECNDEGMVYRPEHDIEHFIPAEVNDANADMMIEECLVVTKSGGIDACPACAAKAEIAFRDRIQTSPENQEPAKLRLIK